MKTIKTLALFLGLSLGIASCSKEGQDSSVLVERQVEGASKHVGSKDSVFVNFTIGADTEELRLAQSLNASGVPVSPFMEEKDVVIRFAVRKSGRVTYTDAVCKKVPGENKVTYKGVIRLPDLGYENTPPTNLTGHEIAGILLGEANNGTQFVEEVDANTVKSIEQTELLTSENDVVRSKIPYLLDWTEFPLTTQGKQTSKLTLHFKPVGNLLRLKFSNQLNEAKTLQSIRVESNAFVTQANFDFTQARLKPDLQNYYSTIPTTASGSPTEPITTNFKVDKTYTLNNPLEISPKTTNGKWYYLWVMPLVLPDNAYLRRHSEPKLTKAIGRGSDGQDYNMLTLCSPLEEGSNSLTVSFKGTSTLSTAFKGGKLPLWYVAESDAGVFTHSEAMRVNRSGYYIPEKYDFTVIHGFNSNRARRPFDYLSLFNDPQGTYDEEVLFPGEKNPVVVQSTYNFVREEGKPPLVEDINDILWFASGEPNWSSYKPIICYALRFEQCGERDKLTAYRYQYHDYVYDYDNSITNRRGRQISFEVNSIFLGSSFTGDINTISQPSFWSGKPGMVTRIFPTYHGDHADVDTDSYHSRWGKGATWELYPYRLKSEILTSAFDDLGKEYLRLFKNEFKTAQ